jgi:hypothetical protein
VVTHPDHAPFLGPVAAGSVGLGAGGPFDVISIDGNSGGVGRRVVVEAAEPFNFVVQPPPGAPSGAGFVIFGKFAAPTPQESIALLPPLFGMAFRPPFFDPADASLFTFTGTLMTGLLPATPAPWLFNFPIGLPGGSTTTFQGFISEGGVLRTTNGLILRVNL